jgi:hypothetical protein
MGRAQVEFIQSQNVAWEPAARHGLRRPARVKRLSHDPATGAFTALVEYERGARIATPLRRAGSEEWFVLYGAATLNGHALGRHHYAFLPPGTGVASLDCPDGALVLTYFNGGFADTPADAADGRAGDPGADAGAAPPPPPRYVDSYAMPWDATVLDPKLVHLRLSRKILRADPDCRTYLLAGLPQGRPADGRVGLETHPHDEEMFLVSGDMSAPQGVMHPGAYFYRPRGILHGPHFSDLGFFMFMRNPGTDRISTDWTTTVHALPQEPPLAPVLPADAPADWARPLPTRVPY